MILQTFVIHFVVGFVWGGGVKKIYKVLPTPNLLRCLPQCDKTMADGIYTPKGAWGGGGGGGGGVVGFLMFDTFVWYNHQTL